MHAVAVDVPRREPKDDVNVRDVYRLLRARWRMICGVVVACVAIAALYNSMATRFYEAQARVLVEPESQPVVPFRPVGSEDTERFDYFITQLEVLRSRALARQTLDRLHLQELPGKLTVAPVKSDLGPSRVVNLTFVSTDAKMAAATVNTLAETYVAQNLEVRRQGSRDAAKWLNDRLSTLRKDVTTTQGALQQYREQKDSVSLGQEQNIVVQKLAQLNSSVTAARTDRLAQEALYQQLRAVEQSGAPLDTFGPILSNTFIQGLKAELASLQRERAQLSERFLERHPEIIRVDTAIAAAEARLNGEISKAVEVIRNDYRAAQAKERAFVSALEQQKHEVLDLNKKSIGFGALQRDATSSQQIFDSVLQRLKEAELSGELQANNVRILDVADVPRNAIWPRIWVNLLLAILGGGFIGIAIVLGSEFLNPRITSPADVEEALGLPLLGVTPRVDALKHRRPLLTGLPVQFQEALRGIRTRILLSPLPTVRTLAVTSTTAGEGKTLIASHLATSLALAGRRVLLVDADMRRPQLHTVFGVSASPGLANVMAGEVKPSDALLTSKIQGLFILPAGANVASPSELLDTDRLNRLLDAFRKVFDIVVLDCPPVMALADASITANVASAVLFVVGSGASTREGVRAAVDRLTSVQAEVVGVVLNNATPAPETDYYYAAHYDSQPA
jgi:capsular exopolysaccharide synthesis family protein